MKAYLDASVFSMLMLHDRSWETVGAWIATNAPTPTMSDFGRGDFASAVSIRYRSGGVPLSEARDMLAAADDILRGWTKVSTTPEDIAEATNAVAQFDLALRLPDAIHIAIARRLGQTLVTTDKRQARAAIALGLPTIDPTEGTVRS